MASCSTTTSDERTSARHATTEAAPTPANTQNASPKPLVNAVAGSWCDASRVRMCVNATYDATATPTAPPICSDVLIKPDARPASCDTTPASAAIDIGMNANAMPTPTIR